MFVAVRNQLPSRLGVQVAKATCSRYSSWLPTLMSRWASTQAKKQHVVVALGGNALLKRKEVMTMENQRQNIRLGMQSLAGILKDNTVTMVHGNGPQVGLLVLESAAYEKATGLEQMQLDVLDAETEGKSLIVFSGSVFSGSGFAMLSEPGNSCSVGMIGYMLEQEMQPYLEKDRGMVTVLSQIIVDPKDPAFENPTKFIGPVYTKEEAEQLGLPIKPDGEHYRRVVPSPLPVRLLDNQLAAVKTLTEKDCVVICAGGGGIPVVKDLSTGHLQGVEAVIDKDRAACMVGLSLNADGLLILTDVAAVAEDFQSDHPKWIKTASPGMLRSLSEHFPAGSMGPKVESVIEFVEKGGRWAAIGSLAQADHILAGESGTLIKPSSDGQDFIQYYDSDQTIDRAA